MTSWDSVTSTGRLTLVVVTLQSDRLTVDCTAVVRQDGSDDCYTAGVCEAAGSLEDGPVLFL